MDEIGKEEIGGKWPGATPETAVRVESPFFQKTDIWEVGGKKDGEILVEKDWLIYTNRKLREQGERRKFRILKEGKGETKKLTHEAWSSLEKPTYEVLEMEGEKRPFWLGLYVWGIKTESDPKKVTRKKGGTTFTRWEIETRPSFQIDGQGMFVLHQKILECTESQAKLGLVSQEDYEKVRKFVEEETKWKEATEERFKVAEKERPLSLRERLERQIKASSEPLVKLSLSAGDLKEFIRSIPLPQGAEWSRIDLSFENGRLIFSGSAGKFIFGIDFKAEFWVGPEKGIQAKLIDISDQSRRQAIEENLQKLDTHLRSYLERNFPGIDLKGIKMGKDSVILEVEKQ